MRGTVWIIVSGSGGGGGGGGGGSGAFSLIFRWRFRLHKVKKKKKEGEALREGVSVTSHIIREPSKDARKCFKEIRRKEIFHFIFYEVRSFRVICKHAIDSA